MKLNLIIGIILVFVLLLFFNMSKWIFFSNIAYQPVELRGRGLWTGQPWKPEPVGIGTLQPELIDSLPMNTKCFYLLNNKVCQ